MQVMVGLVWWAGWGVRSEGETRCNRAGPNKGYGGPLGDGQGRGCISPDGIGRTRGREARWAAGK